MNQVTHWLDGSQIYGSEKTLAWELRQRSRGRMKIESPFGKSEKVL